MITPQRTLGARALFWFMLVTAACAAGCSTPKSVPLSPDTKNSIKNIQVDKQVSKPIDIYWRGGEQAWSAALFGAVGAMSTAGSGAREADYMKAMLEREKIDISEIVHTEATRQIATSGRFSVVDPEKADAVLTLSVDLYGFNKTHPFGSNMNPLIQVTGKLSKPNQEVVWQQTEMVSDLASDNDQGQSMSTYQSEPAKLRTALTEASEVAVKRVLAKLQ